MSGMSKAAHQKVASWVFASLTLAFLVLSYVLTRSDSAVHPIVRFVGALCAGLFGYFFTGTTKLVAEGGLPRFGRTSVQAGGGAALFIFVFLAWPGASTFTVQVLLHTGEKSDLVPVDGSLSLPLGNTLPTARVEAPGRALFQGLPQEWKGKTVSCSLDSRDYKLVAPGTLLLDDKGPAYLQVEARHAFASPSEADVRLELLSANAMRAGPYPEVVWLNIQLRAVALAERPVPLGAKATFSVLMPNGAEMRAADLELASGLSGRGVVLEPNEVTEVYLDDGVPREFFALHGTSHMWQVRIRYDPLVEESEVEFLLGPFDFNSTTITFER